MSSHSCNPDAPAQALSCFQHIEAHVRAFGGGMVPDKAPSPLLPFVRPQQLHHRFTGCKCRSKGRDHCNRESCNCAAAGRECDPLLCLGCTPTAEGRAVPGAMCCNMNLLLGQRCATVVGPSTIPGE
jgi:hypothetical protein